MREREGEEREERQGRRVSCGEKGWEAQGASERRETWTALPPSSPHLDLRVWRAKGIDVWRVRGGAGQLDRLADAVGADLGGVERGRGREEWETEKLASGGVRPMHPSLSHLTCIPSAARAACASMDRFMLEAHTMANRSDGMARVCVCV